MNISLKKISFVLLRIYFALIPFTFIPNNIIYWPYKIIPVLIILLEIDVVIKFFKHYSHRYLYLIAFTILAIAISFGTKYFYLASKGSLLYFFAYGFLLPVLINKLSSKDNQQKLFKSFSFGIILTAIAMALYFIPALRLPSYILKYHLTGGILNPRLGIGGVNDYAIVLVIHFLWLNYLVREINILKNSKYFYYILDIFLIVVTGSRVGLYSVFLYFLSNIIIFRKKVFNTKTFLSLILLILIGISIYFVFLESEYKQIRVFNIFELQTRLEFLELSRYLQPFGSGIGTHSLTNYFHTPYSIRLSDMHNNFLIMFYDTGFLVAPLFYIYLFLTIFNCQIKRKILIFIFFFNIIAVTHIFQDIFTLFLAIGMSSLNSKKVISK